MITHHFFISFPHFLKPSSLYQNLFSCPADLLITGRVALR